LISKVCFLVAFTAGLGLAVYSMLHGVERSKGAVEHLPSAFFNAPAASALTIVFGAVGYLLLTRSTLGTGTTFLIAIVSAAVATVGAILLLARWALPYSGIRDDDEKIQGVFARVTRAISPSKPGEIVFQADGVNHTLVAESTQESEIPRDAEVVIDAIRDGVARVELWSTVEQRL
jgi:hypothetical protein